MINSQAPIAKHVILVGAGNAHLVFVNRWGMKPWPGVAVTLISEAPVIPYSAMVPGWIARQYQAEEVTIDLVRLSAARQVRFVPGVVTAINPETRQVFFADRPPLTYDVLSLGVGSLPACPEELRHDPASLLMRPLSSLMHRLEEIEAHLASLSSSQASATGASHGASFHLVVVGGGASGCELTLALHERFKKYTSFRLTLFQSQPRLLPNHPEQVGRHFASALCERGVEVRLDHRVQRFYDGFVETDSGEKLRADMVLWATQAAPTPLLRQAGLAVDGMGFLRVRATLQSIDRPEVFGTGDCVTFEDYPRLPRNGVHAVRQGRVLFDNVQAFLLNQSLRQFRPQRWTLALLNSADGEAVLSYGRISAKSRLLRRFKDWIDRRWMRKFAVTPMTASPLQDSHANPMHCGGCGSKIASDVLSRVLQRLTIPDDPRIVLGCREGEDAAAHRLQPELFGTDPRRLIEVQTVDYFKTFCDDPYLFGCIAAQHALSDLYAMNARPFSALALATLPYARGPIQEAMLFEMLSGALATFQETGVVLTGGHTTEGPELALGFAVTGFGEEDRLFRKGSAHVGDFLILTKPLGTGALWAAWRQGRCRAEWFETVVSTSRQSNRRAAEIFDRAGVEACTDVTGFGLAGHLLEMLDASQVSATIDPDAIPLLPGFREVTAQGIVSSLHEDNRKVACRIVGEPHPWLFDPQTSGGLLASVRAASAGSVVAQLREAGYHHATVVGEVTAVGKAPSLVIAPNAAPLAWRLPTDQITASPA